MKSYLVRIFATTLAVASITLLTHGLCSAQSLADRQSGPIHVQPTEDEEAFSVGVSWSVTVGPSSVPLDLSTHVDLYLNGSLFRSSLVEVFADAGTNFCGAPPCNGSCGSVSIAGMNAALLCMVDGPPPSDDCDCGQFISTGLDPSIPLVPGDEITVILRPAEGSVPDDDPHNDTTRMTFLGGPSFWNRAIRSVGLQPTSLPDTYDVEVRGAVEFDGLAGNPYLNLGLLATLEVDGVPMATMDLALDVQPATSGSCFYLGCGSYCGVIGNIERSCDEVLFNGCVCGGHWILLFPDVELEPGNDLTVVLRPAPGGLPELPEFEEDDRFTIGATSSAEGEVRSPGRLLNAVPNPARASVGTKLGFQLTRPAGVQLEIVDISGRSIRSLANSKFPAGTFSRQWDLRNDSGDRVTNGVYFYAMTVDGADPDVLKLLVVD